MWLLIFPLVGALYLTGLLAVVVLKMLVALTYCLIAVVAGGVQAVIRYTT